MKQGDFTPIGKIAAMPNPENRPVVGLHAGKDGVGASLRAMPDRQSDASDSRQSTGSRSETSDARKAMILWAMGSRLTYLGDQEMQRLEVAMAIEVLKPLDDELLRIACISAVRNAGNSFVLAQHIWAAAEPDLAHRRTMARFSAMEQDTAREHRLAIEAPARMTPERADEIMREIYGEKKSDEQG